MFAIIIKLALLAALTSGVTGAPVQKAEDYKISELAFMAGSWEGKLQNQTLQETWLAPEGGSLLGMMRMDDGTKTSIREFEVIEETSEGISMTIKHVTAKMEEIPGSLLGRKLISLKDSQAVFETTGPEPKQRLIYEKDGKDGMVATIEMTRNGQPVKLKIPMKRSANSLPATR